MEFLVLFVIYGDIDYFLWFNVFLCWFCYFVVFLFLLDYLMCWDVYNLFLWIKFLFLIFSKINMILIWFGRLKMVIIFIVNRFVLCWNMWKLLMCSCCKVFGMKMSFTVKVRFIVIGWCFLLLLIRWVWEWC